MKRKRPIGLITLVIIFILASFFVVTVFARNWLQVFSGYSDLQGEIIAERRSLHVGDIISLELTVPKRFESVHFLHWRVVPASAGIIDYVRITEEDSYINTDGDTAYPTEDRKAYFTAEQPGRCAIVVYGLYKQTEAQFIARLELAVTP